MILPGVVQEIADVIGSDAALYLIGQLPTCEAGAVGKRSTRVIMYVPKRLRADHRLVQILGVDRAQKLVDGFGGETLQPANCREVYVRFRDSEVRRMDGEGVAASVIADIMGVTVRTIRNLTTANDNAPVGANDNVRQEIPQED